MAVSKEDLHSAVAGAVTELRGEIAETRQELRGEIVETRQELRGEIAETRQELRDEIAETRQQLRGEIAETRQELRDEIAETRQGLRGEIAETRQQLRTVEQNMIRHIAEVAEHTARIVEARIDARLEVRLAAQEDRLGAQLASHVLASEERNRELLRSLDDRYRAMPGEVAALRRDLDAHVADDTRHTGPAPDAGE
jgi:gas vesicle protein